MCFGQYYRDTTWGLLLIKKEEIPNKKFTFLITLYPLQKLSSYETGYSHKEKQMFEAPFVNAKFKFKLKPKKKDKTNNNNKNF